MAADPEPDPREKDRTEFVAEAVRRELDRRLRDEFSRWVTAEEWGEDRE